MLSDPLEVFVMGNTIEEGIILMPYHEAPI
jgi:hypothetical protein